MLNEWLQKYGLSRLQIKLLTTSVPVFFILSVIFVTIMEVTLYSNEKTKLENKLERVTETFTIAVAEPLWNADLDRTSSILEAMTLDKDLVSAVVNDNEGNPFAIMGEKISVLPKSLPSQKPITYIPNLEQVPRVIGTLVIGFTDKHLLTTTYRRIAIASSLAILLTLLLITTNTFIHRRLIGTPQQRILALIQSSSDKPRGQRVNWSSDDEIGAIVTAFNHMLDNQEQYYVELEIQVEKLAQEVSETSNLLQATHTNMRGGLVVYDAHGKMLYWNDRYFEMFNLPERFRRIGQDYADILKHDTDVSFFKEGSHHNLDINILLQRRLKGFFEGKAENEEQHFEDGRIIEVRRNPMPGGGQISIFNDITARKEFEKRMIEKESQLMSVLDNIPGGIRYVDKDRNYVFFNSKYCELYDFPEDLLKIGESTRIENLYQAKRGDLGVGDHDTIVDKWLEKLPILQEPQTWERTTIHGKILEVNTTPTPNGGVINVVTDITKRRQAVDELNKAKIAAELANRSKSDFLATMSHELRTPLNAILGFSAMIKDQMLGPNKQNVYAEYGADIFNSGSHLLGLINDLLDLSKIEAGKQELNFEHLDTHKAILENIRTIDPIAIKSNVKIETDIEDLLPPLYADQRAFDQIALNLLSNAVKFTPQNGLVSIRVFADKESIHIVITDTGIGIENENIDKIMKPWGQIIDPMKAKYKGSGLGLPIVNSLVELHGGKLSLQSEVGKGTTVMVILPISKPELQT